MTVFQTLAAYWQDLEIWINNGVWTESYDKPKKAMGAIAEIVVAMKMGGQFSVPGSSYDIFTSNGDTIEVRSRSDGKPASMAGKAADHRVKVEFRRDKGLLELISIKTCDAKNHWQLNPGSNNFSYHPLPGFVAIRII